MVSDDGASVRDYFGWRVCRCRKHPADSAADAVGSPSSPQEWGRWPLVHIGARVVALLYIVAYHVWQTCESEENDGGAIFWRNYLIKATAWALGATLLYFVLINVFTALSWRTHLSALLATSTHNRNTHPPPPTTPDGSSTLPHMLRACSACIYVAVVLELFVTIMYWGTLALSTKEQETLARNWLGLLQTHGVMCVCVGADLFLTNVPLFPKDTWWIVMVYVAYMVVNMSYTLSTGSPIYDYMTWKEVNSIWIVAGGTVLISLCTVSVYFFDRWQQSVRRTVAARPAPVLTVVV
eukprot:GEMP01061370.1.p1 GENE.GEMP01061370.1~~GEMP01061370.1.p1  ORF type:complete len:315 (+),score=60.76 GEMP01061370.1:61-945(+)